MNKIRVTKIFAFEAAHALHGYDGKCRNIHGHSYKLEVTILGTPIMDNKHPKSGMVIDFGDIKKIVNEEIIDKFDHAVLLNRNSPHKALGENLAAEGHKIILTDYQPSCENMVLDMVTLIKSHLDKAIELASVKLYETETSFAEWRTEDNP
ncbi:MAG: 6-carboxytetrahydropterin synthase [Weeksellaceae bacterium]